MSNSNPPTLPSSSMPSLPPTPRHSISRPPSLPPALPSSAVPSSLPSPISTPGHQSGYGTPGKAISRGSGTATPKGNIPLPPPPPDSADNHHHRDQERIMEQLSAYQAEQDRLELQRSVSSQLSSQQSEIRLAELHRAEQ